MKPEPAPRIIELANLARRSDPIEETRARRSRNIVLLLGLAGILSGKTAIAAAELELPHIHVTYDGAAESYARAVARTVQTARAVCAETYGFSMPDVIHITITAAPKQPVRLFNDGVDTFTLSVRTEADLRKPTASGVFHIYGLCHEVGHLAMYRAIKDHSWLSTAGAEGWAHYLGSVLVDEVYTKEGIKLWPDQYDYRADGTRRLDKQLSLANPSDVARSAQFWRELATALGHEKTPRLFDAWGRVKIDAADPAAVLKRELLQLAGDEKLSKPWDQAATLLLVRREGSRFPKHQVDSARLTGHPRDLVHDDGKPAGKSSMAGGGHAVRFRLADASWYLTAVEIYGARYGAPTAPRDNFHVWLCDDQFRAIADFEIPYAKFDRGPPRWVRIPVNPTNVPAEFILCVGFNPSARKGVFVHYDAGSGADSLTGLPGAKPGAFTRGDWMIRVRVDQPKEADALTPKS